MYKRFGQIKQSFYYVITCLYRFCNIYTQYKIFWEHLLSKFFNKTIFIWQNNFPEYQNNFPEYQNILNSYFNEFNSLIKRYNTMIKILNF